MGYQVWGIRYEVPDIGNQAWGISYMYAVFVL